MMTIHFEKGDATSSFVCEDYIAAKVVLGENPEDCRHVVFEYSDTDALEFGLDHESGQIKKIVLVLCNHFCISQKPVNAPSAPNGKLFLEVPRVNSCDHFETVIHPDGAHIILSTNNAKTLVACGNVVVGSDDCKNITELYVKDLNEEEVEHIKRELDFDLKC